MVAAARSVGPSAADTAVIAKMVRVMMAALGLSTHLGAVPNAGVKPVLLAAILFSWLVIGGAQINRWVSALLA